MTPGPTSVRRVQWGEALKDDWRDWRDWKIKKRDMKALFLLAVIVYNGFGWYWYLIYYYSNTPTNHDIVI